MIDTTLDWIGTCLVSHRPALIHSSLDCALICFRSKETALNDFHKVLKQQMQCISKTPIWNIEWFWIFCAYCQGGAAVFEIYCDTLGRVGLRTNGHLGNRHSDCLLDTISVSAFSQKCCLAHIQCFNVSSAISNYFIWNSELCSKYMCKGVVDRGGGRFPKMITLLHKEL